MRRAQPGGRGAFRFAALGVGSLLDVEAASFRRRAPELPSELPGNLPEHLLGAPFRSGVSLVTVRVNPLREYRRR